mmetsp:Transcript_74984/g.178985  ORF Transcript_74984/g.178985 Transcript_74984/m.178985 type:complete len:221 (+) Transcript_74984:862-1524(+)
MSTKFPKAWTMVKVMRKTAERMVPFLLLSKLNFRFPVKKTVRITMSMTFFSKNQTAPMKPGTPPSPSGGGGESSAAAAGAAAATAPETLPIFFKCCMFFSTVPGLWIMTHSSVASLPKYAMIACSPPGWIEIHLVTSRASPWRMIQASVLVLCFATSSGDIPSLTGAAAAPPAGAPPAPILPIIFRCWTFFSTVPGLWIMTHSSVASLPKYAMIACSPPG